MTNEKMNVKKRGSVQVKKGRGVRAEVVSQKSNPEEEEIRVAALMSPGFVNVASSELFLKSMVGDLDLAAMVGSLQQPMSKVDGGDMKEVEHMLVGQAHALQSIFGSLARRAHSAELLKQYDLYMRFALKAQSQCRATLETLANIKNPPVVLARQANITTGPQQVNNGVMHSRAEETEIEQKEVLDGERVDS